MGTANVLAREFGLMSMNLAPLWAATESRRVRQLDIGACDDDPFLMSAGFGFDAEAVARVNPAWKRGAGRVEYAAACAVSIIAYPRLPRWRSTEGPLAAPDAGWILIANTSRYAGGFRISDGSSFDGTFEVFRFQTRSSIALAGTLARGLIGARWPVAARLVRGESLTLEGTGAVQLDGDLWSPPAGPVTIRMRLETIPVLVAAVET
jgi:diacylglycerol kinase (ATP)